MRIKSMVHAEDALGKKGATLTNCWRRRGHTRSTQKTPICQNNSETYLQIKSMVHPEGTLGKKGATLTGC